MGFKINVFKHVWCLLMIGLPFAVAAQFTGPTNPTVGVNTNYTYNDGVIYSVPNWTVFNGTVISSSSSGTTYSVTVQWTASGAGALEFRSRGNFVNNMAVTVHSIFTLSGGAYYCSGGSGVTLSLSGSEQNSSYQLFKDGVVFGSPQSGTGSPLSWAGITQEGTYTAKTTSGILMSGSAYVGVSTPPAIFTVTGGGSFCAGGSGMPISLSGSEINIAYYLLNNGSNVGSLAGNGGTLPWPNQTTSGTYTIVAYNEQGCNSMMTGSATIIKYDLPTTSNAGPGQSGTATCGLTTVTLAANTPTVGVGSWSVVTGTGGSFGNTSSPTSTFSGNSGATYTLKWTITNGVCSSSLSNVSVTLNRNPTASNAGSGQGIWGSGSVTLSANTPTVGTAAWSMVSGPSTSMSQFANGTSPASTFTPAGGAGNYVLSWTVSASPCSSSSSNVTISVLTVPVITAPQTVVIKGSNITMDAGPGYDIYSWRNSVNTQVATTQTYSTNVVDSYRVIVTKSGYTSLPSQPFTLTSQLASMNMNYIVTNTVLVNNITDSNVIANLSVDQANQSISYFDGLGRPVQNVITQGSPLKSDIVQPVVYDEFGRESKKYLPLTNGNNGWYKSDPVGTISGNYTVSPQYLFYNNATDKIADDTRPFNETVFETSPLNRPLKDYGPGLGWNNTNVIPTPTIIYDKPVAHQYLLNSSATEQVIAWIVDPTSGLPVPAPTGTDVLDGGYYTSGQLSIKSTNDEQGHEVREYTDKRGHVILKKVQAYDNAPLSDSTKWAHTYYIYDDFGHLVMVLSPEAFNAITK